MNLKGRSFLTLKDYTKDEIVYLIKLATELKKKKKGKPVDPGVHGRLLAGKNIVLLFDKTSTRTRCSFEVAAYDEGAGVTFLTNSQMGKKESLEDTAKVLGRLYDGIEYRGFEHKIVEELAEFSGVPVWNGLTDDDHPTQVLADFLTASEHLDKPLSEMKLAYVGDGRNNVARSLMLICSKMGIHFTIISPQELFPDNEIREICQPFAKESGSIITVTDQLDAVKGADAIYTDVWVSMGEESLKEQRVKLLSPYQVNDLLMERTQNNKCIFMHCLPAVKNEEVTQSVIEGSQSRVWEQAENRKHTIKAIMLALI